MYFCNLCETPGNRHKDTPTTTFDPGRTWRGGSAVSRARRCGQAKRETLGDTHASTLISINNLGALLKAQGDLAGAEILMISDS